MIPGIAMIPRSSMIGTPALLAACLAPVLAGCGERVSPGDASTEVVRTTHPELGVPMIVSGAGLARRDLGWEVSAEPELVLGALDGGPDAELFSRLGGAKQRPDGTLFVVEAEFGEVRVFDREGRHLRTLGRLGDGPREFRIPRMVRTPDHFDVRIWDRRHRRMLTVGRDLELGNARTLDADLGDPLGTIGDTVMTKRLFFIITRDEGPIDQPVRYYAVRPEGDATLVDSLPDPQFVTILEMEGRSLSGVRPVAFAARPIEAMHFNRLLLVPGAAPEIRWHGPGGAVERIVAAELEPEPATRDMVVEYGRNWLRSVDVEIHDDGLEAYRRMPAVDRIAAFDELLVDTEGHVWARTYRRDETRPRDRWLVFAPGGELRGYVDLPHLDHVDQIGPDFVLGRLTGDLGVPLVARYGLTR